MDVIKKKEFCLYCGVKMESKTAKRKFCSDKCRVYYSRGNKPEIVPPQKQTAIINHVGEQKLVEKYNEHKISDYLATRQKLKNGNK